jgi:hypothetical protein
LEKQRDDYHLTTVQSDQGRLALAVAVCGAVLVVLSLTIFGAGASATLNPTPQSATAPVSTVEPTPAIPTVPAGTPSAAPASPADATGATGEPAKAPEGEVGAEPAPGTVVMAKPVDIASGGDPTATPGFAAMTPDEQTNARGWLETQAITDACMSEKGFDEYTYYAYWNHPEGTPRPVHWTYSVPKGDREAAQIAEYGNTGVAADYHWDDAGCWGYAVHMMGNDNNR